MEETIFDVSVSEDDFKRKMLETWNDLVNAICLNENERNEIIKVKEDALEIMCCVFKYIMKFRGSSFHSTRFFLECMELLIREEEYKFLFAGDSGTIPVYDMNNSTERKNAACRLSVEWITFYYSKYKQDEHIDDVLMLTDLEESIIYSHKDRLLLLLEKKVQQESENIRIDQDFVLRLKRFADETVVGQETLKEVLALKLYKYFRFGDRTPLLVIGPTGCGKNYTLNVMTQFEDIKDNLVFDVLDASHLTPEGFTGLSFSEYIKEINKKVGIRRAKNMQNNCEARVYTVVQIDEIDKILLPHMTSSGENVNLHLQNQLLTALAGTDQKTSNILFILTGAFSCLDELEDQRRTHKKIGFMTSEEPIRELMNANIRNDLIRCGAVREFVGRLTGIVRVYKHTEKELQEIITHPKIGVIKRKQEEFAKQGWSLYVTPEAINILTKKAFEMNVGARSIVNIVDELISSNEFDMIKGNYTGLIIHEGVISRGEQAIYLKKEESSCL